MSFEVISMRVIRRQKSFEARFVGPANVAFKHLRPSNTFRMDRSLEFVARSRPGIAASKAKPEKVREIQSKSKPWLAVPVMVGAGEGPIFWAIQGNALIALGLFIDP